MKFIFQHSYKRSSMFWSSSCGQKGSTYRLSAYGKKQPIWPLLVPLGLGIYWAVDLKPSFSGIELPDKLRFCRNLITAAVWFLLIILEKCVLRMAPLVEAEVIAQWHISSHLCLFTCLVASLIFHLLLNINHHFYEIVSNLFLFS